MSGFYSVQDLQYLNALDVINSDPFICARGRTSMRCTSPLCHFMENVDDDESEEEAVENVNFILEEELVPFSKFKIVLICISLVFAFCVFPIICCFLG